MDPREKLEEYIDALTGCGRPIDDDAELAEVGMDSISLVKTLVFVEREFGVSLGDAGFGREDVGTFGAFLKAVRRALGDAGK